MYGRHLIDYVLYEMFMFMFMSTLCVPNIDVVSMA